jgi:hypothetical protein
MLFILIGVTVVQRLRTHVFHSPSPSDPLPASTKTLAWTALICWLGAVTAGRLLAYI